MKLFVVLVAMSFVGYVIDRGILGGAIGGIANGISRDIRVQVSDELKWAGVLSAFICAVAVAITFLIAWLKWWPK